MLFAYRASVQESTRESPFYLLYGRDPRFPTDSILNHVVCSYVVDVDEYKTAMTIALLKLGKQHKKISRVLRKNKNEIVKES